MTYFIIIIYIILYNIAIDAWAVVDTGAVDLSVSVEAIVVELIEVLLFILLVSLLLFVAISIVVSKAGDRTSWLPLSTVFLHFHHYC